MASWRHPLRNHLDRLKNLRHTLASNRDRFWAGHRDAYRGECAEILRTQLLLTRPPDEDEDAWAAKVEKLAAAVADRMFADGDAVSLMIFVSSQNLPPVAGPLEEVIGRENMFAWVKKWVEAGRAGDPLGKEFGNEDYPRTDSDIAITVYIAMRNRTATLTVDSLRRFVDAQSAEQLKPYLLQILKAWRVAMAARLGPDYRAWLRSVIHEAGG